jgi:DNA-binding transcriptional LysR family regulator
MTTSIGAASRGYGFAWFPEEKIRSELAAGVLKILPLKERAERFAQLHLVWRDDCGTGVRQLQETLRASTRGIAD